MPKAGILETMGKLVEAYHASDISMASHANMTDRALHADTNAMKCFRYQSYQSRFLTA